VEQYSPERKAEFLLSNAIDDADYPKARKELRKLGLDPDSIPPSATQITDRLFLDGNVLFFCGHRPGGGLVQIWKL
jgi:hypothetical protein